MTTYAIGVDFGTESGRAVLVDVADGREVATAVHTYANGVIDERLPPPIARCGCRRTGRCRTRRTTSRSSSRPIPAVLRQGGVDPDGRDRRRHRLHRLHHAAGQGATARRSAYLPEWRDNPHAWVKLWKHHAAQPEADRINAVGAPDGRRPGSIATAARSRREWFFRKALQILDEAPEVYAAADRLIEAPTGWSGSCTGVETRNTCTAGYKAMWSKARRLPEPRATSPPSTRAWPTWSTTRCAARSRRWATRAGGLTAEAAGWTGLRRGHGRRRRQRRRPRRRRRRRPSSTPGRMVMIMGTSTCHMVLGREPARRARACAASCEDGIIPGFFGYEAGQIVRRRHLRLVRRPRRAAGVPGRRPARAALDLHEPPGARRPPGSGPGESGLLALDWWNGNRSSWSTPSSPGC